MQNDLNPHSQELTNLFDKKLYEHQMIQAKEIIAANIQLNPSKGIVLPETDLENHINSKLAQVNQELEKYTNYAVKSDYAFAIASGLLTGAIDAAFVGQLKVTKDDIGLSHEQINRFIENYADKHSLKEKHLKGTIENLENKYKVLQDNIWKGADIGVYSGDHHLADLAHHPTPLGLLAAIIVQFFRIGIFIMKSKIENKLSIRVLKI